MPGYRLGSLFCWIQPLRGLMFRCVVGFGELSTRYLADVREWRLSGGLRVPLLGNPRFGSERGCGQVRRRGCVGKILRCRRFRLRFGLRCRAEIRWVGTRLLEGGQRRFWRSVGRGGELWLRFGICG
ncbi:hypothetical protein BKN37_15630 [Mycobacterium talmoniae]|uniref:Uncharacterized protein n=1 Tax=Mycobacterium talmoniae TaxID=1858794 RepID=A0A1S1NHG2_9MYCO|nr:hypothetical protein BKN37_15630 [Mycobacterium talmoniae]